MRLSSLAVDGSFADTGRDSPPLRVSRLNASGFALAASQGAGRP